jgi:hypothetical protein
MTKLSMFPGGQPLAKEEVRGTRRALELGGAILCPVLGCSAPPYPDADVVRHVAEEAAVSRYLEGRRLLPIAKEVARVFEQAQTTLRAMQDALEGRLHARRGESESDACLHLRAGRA